MSSATSKMKEARLFTNYEINQCLWDQRKIFAFKKAIQKAVKKGDVVVDAGSGSGILALLAAQAGAERVYALDVNERACRVIENNAKRNGFGDVIKVINADASVWRPDEKVDIIIAELLSSGLLFEPEMQVFNNLRPMLRKGGIMIPEEYVSYVELMEAQEMAYGLNLTYDSRYFELNSDKALSKPLKYDWVNFYKKEPLGIKEINRIKATGGGVVNAVRITSDARLFKDFWLGETSFFSNPEIIFLKDKIKVRKGGYYHILAKVVGGEDSLTSFFALANTKEELNKYK